MRLFRRGERVSTLDLLVAGLGNPGREHERDRHNVGWMVVDELARRHSGTFRAKFSGRVAELRIDGRRVALLEPETYMNDSGRSVGAAARFFKVDPPDLLVVHDEVDLELGQLQLRVGVGSRATTGCARSRRRSARRSSPGYESASGGPAAAIAGPSPISCSPRSRSKTTPARS